ncbi:MAG: CBS domain-containing protein [Candidatus Helarchaeota archaeon]|nr:CBS domain-containing protein [Candidatus Helarchaeota archaeon]
MSTIKKILTAIETALTEEEVIAIGYSTKNVTLIRGDKRVNEAAKIMSDKGISQMPVINEKGQTIGSIKEKTIINKLLQNGQEILKNEVKSIMESKIPEMPITTTVDEAKKMLLQHDAILLTSEEGIEGILTKIDIIKAYSKKV